MDVIEVICKAWEDKNPELLKNIVAPSFTWYETPFVEPITNVDRLLEQWENDLKGQQNIQVTINESYTQGSVVIATWEATFQKMGNQHLSGVFIITLDQDSKLVSFRQWWNAR